MLTNFGIIDVALLRKGIRRKEKVSPDCENDLVILT